MRRHAVGLCIAVAAASILTLAQDPAPTNAFAFFTPAVTISPKDLAAMDKGGSVARVLPGRGREVAIFVAMSVSADGERLAAWVRDVVALKKSPLVPAIQRFSNPPTINDLADLTLEEDDLRAAKNCRPGDCAMKLNRAEMADLRAAIANGDAAGWKSRVQSAFRAIVLHRAETYLAGGHTALPDYDDHDRPTSPATIFRGILDHSEPLTAHARKFADYLWQYPSGNSSDVESFLYWSKEKLGNKIQISITHVSMRRSSTVGEPELLVAGKQIFATHYINGSLALTTILRGPDQSHRYLAYLNRSETDVIGGFFGGLIRSLVERRVKNDAPGILQTVRAKLESGNPPAK